MISDCHCNAWGFVEICFLEHFFSLAHTRSAHNLFDSPVLKLSRSMGMFWILVKKGFPRLTSLHCQRWVPVLTLKIDRKRWKMVINLVNP